ncbi:sensor histidine kinase [soil metagenome]
MNKSIKGQLLVWLLVPLLTLALCSALIGNMLGVAMARDIYDKQLLNSADSVVARIRTKENQITVDLPPSARNILRHNNHDEFYYQVLSPDGQVVFGDKNLPSPAMPIDGEPSFRTTNVNNRELRVVVVSVTSSDPDGEPLLVQAAETRNSRTELAAQLTLTIFLAQLLIIVSGAVAIYFGVQRGLLPLVKVKRAVEGRAVGDLSPLTVEAPLELVSLINALNGLFLQLDQDIELQKRFIANAAHQLRTPLAVLGTYCALAQKLVKEEEAQDVLSQLDQAIVRMTQMVSRLLSLARTEPAVTMTRVNRTFDLNSVASSSTANHVPEAIRRKIELEFRGLAQPALILGDEASVEELLNNLIENSLTYVPAGGNILVETSVNGNSVSLKVEDDGPGIPVAERTRVFERFYRVPGTEQPGTGLGLSIVKEIVSAHKANISITESHLNNGGGGTCITVSFPKVGSLLTV